MKKLLLSALAVAFGLFLSAAPAHAQHGFDIYNQSPQNYGSFHVSVAGVGPYQSGPTETWKVTIRANPNSAANGGHPAGNLTKVCVFFKNAAGDKLKVTNATGSTQFTGSGDASGKSAGSWNWDPYLAATNPDQGCQFKTGYNYIYGDGATEFVAFVTVQGHATTADGHAHASMTNGSAQRDYVDQGGTTVAPEPGAIALLLPALGPLVLALRRRRLPGTSDTDDAEAELVA